MKSSCIGAQRIDLEVVIIADADAKVLHSSPGTSVFVQGWREALLHSDAVVQSSALTTPSSNLDIDTFIRHLWADRQSMDAREVRVYEYVIRTCSSTDGAQISRRFLATTRVLDDLGGVLLFVARERAGEDSEQARVLCQKIVADAPEGLHLFLCCSQPPDAARPEAASFRDSEYSARVRICDPQDSRSVMELLSELQGIMTRSGLSETLLDELKRAMQRRSWLEQQLCAQNEEMSRINQRLALEVGERKRIALWLRSFLDALPESAFVINVDGELLDANQEFARRFGAPIDALIGLSLYELLAPSVAEERRARIEEAVRSKRTVSFRDERGARVIENLVTPVLDESGEVTHLTMLGLDVTAHRNALLALGESERHYQRELRRLASKLTVVEERERRQLACELHDNLGQLLLGTKLALSALRIQQVASESGPTRSLETAASSSRSVIEQALGSIDEMMNLTRSLSFEMSPPGLYDLGLLEALRWLTETLRTRYALNTALISHGEPVPLSDDLKAFVFRGVRTLLLNVVDHSGVLEAWLTLRWLGQELQVSVVDEGRGFVPPSRLSTERFGLFSLSERARCFGGELLLQSTPGRGSALTIRVNANPSAESCG